MHTKKSEMKKMERLKKRSDFLCAGSKGRKWVSHGLIVQIVENDLDVMRVGFTVTKRIDKRAVVRNRIKRRLRAVAADVLSVHGAPGHDYVLIGRATTATRPYETLCKDLKWCLGKLGFKTVDERR